MIAWSYSRLTTFEQCPLQFHLKNITKDIPWVETPALAEGNRKHKVLEIAIGREVRLREGEPCTPIYDDLFYMRALVKEFVASHSRIMVEEELAFKKDWTPCTWFDKETYFRCKIDLTGLNGPKGSILDWKSGKVRVKEDQLKIYNMTALMNWTHLQEVTSSLVFIDHKQFSRPITTTRGELETLRDEFEDRANAIQLAEQRGVWNYTPGYWCDWCGALPNMCPKKRGG